MSINALLDEFKVKAATPNFNAAQYETRVQGLVEAMEANMQEKEAK